MLMPPQLSQLPQQLPLQQKGQLPRGGVVAQWTTLPSPQQGAKQQGAKRPPDVDMVDLTGLPSSEDEGGCARWRGGLVHASGGVRSGRGRVRAHRWLPTVAVITWGCCAEGLAGRGQWAAGGRAPARMPVWRVLVSIQFKCARPARQQVQA